MGSSTSKTMIALLWYLCAIFILYSSMSHGNLNVGCNVKDRETLEIFKRSIKDPWKLLSSWSSEHDCCHWHGVECDNLTRRVTKLDLHCPRNSSYHKCLGGHINLYVLKLEFLSFLDLHDNHFNAIYIPPIHNMSMISTIHHGANFSNLLFLDFSYNHGLRIDDLRWVSHLSSLKYLNLSDVDLSEETLWLHRVNMLPSLLELRLSHCSLNSIQPSLEHVNSSSLRVLDISSNDFYTEVPKWLFNLSSSISFLDLSFNYLKGQVPEELSKFRRLKILVLRFNDLGGSIPEWVGQYKELEHLDLSSNYFSGPIPETLVNLSSLVYLDVGCNLLNGSLPKSLGQLSELQCLFVRNNLLSGSISPFLCQTMIGNKKLVALGLSHNHFSGELSHCWIHWKKHLRAILLRSNNFSGSIPPQICQLSNLQLLDLADNKFSGPIPKCLSNIAAKPTITLDDIFHDSYIHDHQRMIAQDSSRTYVEYQHLVYRHCGQESLFHMFHQEFQFAFAVDLSINDLSGSIPQELFRSSNLKFLNLSHNSLVGSIPGEIGHMKNLGTLDLSRNQLVGEIPQSTTNLFNLTSLNLSYNNLSGKIPLGGQLQTFVPSSYMGNPELYGFPLPEDNSQTEKPNSQDEIPNSSDDEFTTWLRMGMAIGFAYGFWSVCLTLFVNKRWRYAYFRFLNNMHDRIYVFVALKTKWLRENLTKWPK